MAWLKKNCKYFDRCWDCDIIHVLVGIVEFLLEKKNEKNEKIQILHLAILHFDYILNNCAALEKINESLQQKCCHNNTF